MPLLMSISKWQLEHIGASFLNKIKGADLLVVSVWHKGITVPSKMYLIGALESMAKFFKTNAVVSDFSWC
jgi:hypothetical protein